MFFSDLCDIEVPLLKAPFGTPFSNDVPSWVFTMCTLEVLNSECPCLHFPVFFIPAQAQGVIGSWVYLARTV